MLDFQLNTHEKYIRKFLKAFRKIDPQNTGILNEEQFRQLISQLNITRSEEEIDHLLQAVDPYDNEHITLSECLSLLSSVNYYILMLGKCYY